MEFRAGAVMLLCRYSPRPTIPAVAIKYPINPSGTDSASPSQLRWSRVHLSTIPTYATGGMEKAYASLLHIISRINK